MMGTTARIRNIALYRFADLSELPELRKSFREKCKQLGLKGTVILSPEGINCFVAGTDANTREFEAFVNAIPALAGTPSKESFSENVPFKKMLVKLKREIIPMGDPSIQPHRWTAPRISPKELKRWLDEGKEVTLLDTRNAYEVAKGTFRGALDFELKTFREFPKRLKQNAGTGLGKRPVVMFCTGGIRCEKAAAWALREGMSDVYQLDGGILKYFEECGSSHYQGDCFVFDEREALEPSLQPKTG